jgi:hypothetical protein
LLAVYFDLIHNIDSFMLVLILFLFWSQKICPVMGLLKTTLFEVFFFCFCSLLFVSSLHIFP